LTLPRFSTPPRQGAYSAIWPGGSQPVSSANRLPRVVASGAPAPPSRPRPLRLRYRGPQDAGTGVWVGGPGSAGGVPGPTGRWHGCLGGGTRVCGWGGPGLRVGGSGSAGGGSGCQGGRERAILDPLPPSACLPRATRAPLEVDLIE